MKGISLPFLLPMAAHVTGLQHRVKGAAPSPIANINLGNILDHREISSVTTYSPEGRNVCCNAVLRHDIWISEYSHDHHINEAFKSPSSQRTLQKYLLLLRHSFLAYPLERCWAEWGK